MRKLPLAALIFFSCSSQPGAVSAERSAVSATPTSLPADGMSKSFITVVARDAMGTPLSGASVTLNVAGPAPLLDSSTATTGFDGSAQFQLAASAAGTYTVSAAVNGVALSRQATVVFESGSGAGLAFRVQPSTVQVGQVLTPPVVVEAHDAQGNLAVSFTGAVTLALTAAGGATLMGTLTTNAIAGSATFADLRIDKPGSYTLSATATGLSPSASSSFDVTAGAPSKLIFVMPPAGAAAGTTLAPIIVAARDADGNPLPGNTAAITLAIGNGPAGATLTGTATQTAANGAATFSDLALPLAGSYTLSATASGLSGAVSPSFVITSGAATHVVFTMQPQTIEVRAPFSADVAVQDDRGNVVNGAFSVSLTPSSGTLSGTTVITAAGGTGHFSGLALSDEGSIVLTAASSSLTSGTTNPITVTDTTAPAAPVLTVSAHSSTSVTLSWSETGDDGMLGTLSTQELRWSTAPITPANFMQATVAPAPSPAAPGTMQQAAVMGLSPNTPYSFALRVADGAGNAVYATATAGTDACAAGYAGPQCQQCDTGYTQADAGVCVDRCAPNPCTLAPAASCMSNVLTTYAPLGTCMHDATQGFTCAYTPAVVDCAPGLCVNGACQVLRAPGAGDLIVSEVMHTSSLGLSGQWLELYNTSSTDRLDLNNMKIETVGAGGTSFTVPASHVVLPNGTVVLGGSTDSAANGGAAVDVAWTGIDLSNPKHVKLSIGATVIDEVDFGALAPPVTTDQAAQVSQLALGPGGEQQSWYWCGATALMSGGGAGTPNGANGTCGMTITPPIDFCVVQFPKTLGTLDAPVASTVYGQLYEPSVTDRNHNGNDNYPLVTGQLGWGFADAGVASWTWAAAHFNPSYVDSDPNSDNDEMLATFAPPLSGTYVYGYRFHLQGTDVYCDQNGLVSDLNNATWGTASVLAPSADLAAARAAPDAPGQSLSVNGARVTYVRALLGNDPAGFFLQADPLGPGLFVAVDPATLTPPPVVGDRVALTITTLADAGLAREATAVTGYTRVSQGNDVTALIQDLSDAGDLVSNVTAYESELARTTGVLDGGFISSGAGFVAAPFSTNGVPFDPLLTVRLPQAAADALDLATGCSVTVNAPMWRFNAKAEVTAWAQADVSVSACPSPKLLSARTASATSAVVSFDRLIDIATLLADGSQFTADNGLTVSAAAASGPRQVTLTTSTQAMNTTYTLTVAGSLHDTYGKGCVAPDNSAVFAGPGGCMPSAVVISQVYGGGGNSGSTYKNDFIELHNRSTSAQPIGGWSVQYNSATGTGAWQATPIPAGTMLAPGAYFLVQEAAGTGGTTSLPAPDATGSIGLGAAAGRVALVPNATALGAGCPAAGTVVDLVGFGSTAACSEGMPSPAPSNTTAILRNSSGCIDTDMNQSDFTAGAPTPRNTAASPMTCGCN
jgi:hypothetical protein